MTTKTGYSIATLGIALVWGGTFELVNAGGELGVILTWGTVGVVGVCLLMIGIMMTTISERRPRSSASTAGSFRSR